MIRSIREARKAPRLIVRFFRKFAGSDAVRNCLKRLPIEEKREIGSDTKTVRFGWPIGMPVMDHSEGDVWQVRIRSSTRIARGLFLLEDNVMVLLHWFIKKERKSTNGRSGHRQATVGDV